MHYTSINSKVEFPFGMFYSSPNAEMRLFTKFIVYLIQIIFFSLIQVGDSLLTLPQQLEPFFVQDQNINLLAALKVGKIPYQENQGRGILFFLFIFSTNINTFYKI